MEHFILSQTYTYPLYASLSLFRWEGINKKNRWVLLLIRWHLVNCTLWWVVQYRHISISYSWSWVWAFLTYLWKSYGPWTSGIEQIWRLSMAYWKFIQELKLMGSRSHLSLGFLDLFMKELRTLSWALL